MSYQPHVPDERQAMLARIGVGSVDELFADIPASLRDPELSVPPGLSEPELDRLMRSLSARNEAADLVCFLGAGAYDHYIPAAVNELAGRGEFYTGYTPYQAEMTQGILQAIYEYQTIICELCGLDVSNASLYDGATAVWEALLLAARHTRRERFLLSSGVQPNTRDANASYARAADYALTALPDAGGRLDLDALDAALGKGDVAALVVQLPSCFGVLQDFSAAAERCRAAKALLIVVANPMALALVKSPGEMGADICVGEGQPLGVPLQYGGPYFGFMAVRDGLERKMPGRIVGATVDGQGRRGFVLTLQAREQHIRRDKATSNVCTNQALMALRATIYATMLGRQGLREVAEVNLRHAAYLREQVLALPGVEPLLDGPHFNEFAVRVPNAQRWHAAAREAGYLAGLPLGEWDESLSDALLLCATEQRTRAEMDGLVDVFRRTGAE